MGESRWCWLAEMRGECFGAREDNTSSKCGKVCADEGVSEGDDGPIELRSAAEPRDRSCRVPSDADRDDGSSSFSGLDRAAGSSCRARSERSSIPSVKVVVLLSGYGS